MRKRRGILVPVLTLVALLLVSGVARARLSGLASLGCDGCHSDGDAPTVTLDASPLDAAVAQPITLTIVVSQANGPSAGFYLTTAFETPGVFATLESGTTVTTSGVVHTTPRTGSGGSTTFKVQWLTTEPTGVAFDLYALSANGDRSTRGDGAAASRLELTVGCEGERYYIDQDGDGFGSVDPAFRSRVECAAPAGYAPAGDCNDFRAEVYPGAPELCDLLDNDCDGQVDDDVVSQLYCEDGDGDGHGVSGGMTKVDCKPSAGFGTCDDDCDDHDQRYYPGAEEVCDLRDNDCDGEVDEDARATCGLGLCARRARGCSIADCTPGDPLAEVCNGYDDDCDGVVDNGDNLSLCGDPSLRCLTGRCDTAGGAGSSGTAGAGAVGVGGGNGGSGSAGCSLTGDRSALPPWYFGAALLVLALRRRLALLSVRRGRATLRDPPCSASPFVR